LRLRGTEALYFAGQITGAEGYVEAAACGAMTGIHAARQMLGLEPIDFPPNTAFGAVVAHLQNTETHDFQPANVTWTYFDCKKQDRRVTALAAVETIANLALKARSPEGARREAATIF